jgi:hypothetical protein
MASWMVHLRIADKQKTLLKTEDNISAGFTATMKEENLTANINILVQNRQKLLCKKQPRKSKELYLHIDYLQFLV